MNLSKNLPNILTGLGVIGAAAIGVTAAIAQHKVEEDKEEEEVIKKYAKHYWPTAIIFVGTSACIIASNTISKQQYDRLLKAYCSLGAGFAAYRAKVIEEYGADKDGEIIDKIAVAKYDDICNTAKNRNVPCAKLLFYEPITNQFFRMYERDVIAAEYHLNRSFTMRGYAPVSEFLYFLGIGPTDESESIGWSSSYGYYWIDMSHKEIKRAGKEPYFEILYTFLPEKNYEEYDPDNPVLQVWE